MQAIGTVSFSLTNVLVSITRLNESRSVKDAFGRGYSEGDCLELDRSKIFCHFGHLAKASNGLWKKVAEIAWLNPLRKLSPFSQLVAKAGTSLKAGLVRLLDVVCGNWLATNRACSTAQGLALSLRRVVCTIALI